MSLMTIEDSELKKSKLKFSTLKRILPFFRGHRQSIILSTVLVGVSVCLGTIFPLVLRELIDKAIPSKNMTAVYKTGFLYLGLLITMSGLNYIQNIVLSYMGIEVVNAIKLKLLKHVLSLHIGFFDKLGVGRLISRIESDSQKLFMLFSSVGLSLLSAVLTICISMFIMLKTNVKLTLLVLSIAPIIVFLAWIVFKKMRKFYKRDRELYANIVNFLAEHLKALPVLKNLHNLGWSREKFAATNETKRRYEVRISAIEQLVWFLMMVGPQIISVVILYKAVDWINIGAVTIGTIVMFLNYIHMALMPIIQISEQIGEVQRSLGAADKIFEILDTTSIIKESNTPRKFSFEHEITFENVSFAYDPEKPVLKNVSFSLKKGTTLAIVGATGSGKTTIISLLSRFYDPTEGRICVDGVDIKEMALDDLRARLSLVLQDIYLFPGNVLDNLRVLRRDIAPERVYDAARNLRVEPHIMRLKSGYDTELSEDGSNLSFGERQLFSFSRALTFDPEILVMDEATSSVDPYTEAEIQASSRFLLAGRTAIVIAHRLSTIVNADKILVIEQGQLVEEGSHKELLFLDGIYADLYYTQTGITRGVDHA